MSGGHSTYVPKTRLGRWFDARLPLPRLVHDSFIVYPVPRNLNYAYTFGGILTMMMASQIVTGVVLAMHYAADTTLAFNSVEKIMRDVNSGWLLRYLVLPAVLRDPARHHLSHTRGAGSDVVALSG